MTTDEYTMMLAKINMWQMDEDRWVHNDDNILNDSLSQESSYLTNHNSTAIK